MLAFIPGLALFGLLAFASREAVQLEKAEAGTLISQFDTNQSEKAQSHFTGRTESLPMGVRDNSVASSAIRNDALIYFTATNADSAKELWQDDFSGNWVNRWGTVYVNKDEHYSTFQFDGETWLRVTYPEGRERVGFHLKTKIEPQDRVYLEFRLRFPEDFDWVRGGKLPGLYGGLVKAGHVPNGEDGFIVRFMWRADGKGSAYIYHPEQPGKYGEHFRLENFWFQKGVVQKLGLEVVMNTPGLHDGIIRAWLDNVPVVEVTNIRLRDTVSLQIDGIKFDTIFGGNDSSWAPKKDEYIDFGDFKIYSVPPERDQKS